VCQFDTTKADGQFRKPASNKKLLQHIGEFKFTPFEQGASRTRSLCAHGLRWAQRSTRRSSGSSRTTTSRAPD
jgi:hypothetical protein